MRHCCGHTVCPTRDRTSHRATLPEGDRSGRLIRTVKCHVVGCHRRDNPSIHRSIGRIFSCMKSPNLNSMRRVGSRAAVLAAGTMAAVIGFASSAWAGPDTVSDVPNASTTFNGEVFTAVVSGDTIYVGGAVTGAIANAQTTRRNGLAAVDATTGALLAWNPNASGEVRTLAVDGNNVYAGGNFTSIGGLSRIRLAEIDGTTGAVSTTFVHSANTE